MRGILKVMHKARDGGYNCKGHSVYRCHVKGAKNGLTHLHEHQRMDLRATKVLMGVKHSVDDEERRQATQETYATGSPDCTGYPSQYSPAEAGAAVREGLEAMAQNSAAKGEDRGEVLAREAYGDNPEGDDGLVARHPEVREGFFEACARVAQSISIREIFTIFVNGTGSHQSQGAGAGRVPNYTIRAEAEEPSTWNSGSSSDAPSDSDGEMNAFLEEEFADILHETRTEDAPVDKDADANNTAPEAPEDEARESVSSESASGSSRIVTGESLVDDHFSF